MFRSRITVNVPSWPTAAPTSSLPSGRRGRSTTGLSTVPRTLPWLSDTASSVPSGPPPLICSVTLAPSSFRALPIMEAAANARPRAAVATGSVLWISRARSVRSLVETATAFTRPSLEMARIS